RPLAPKDGSCAQTRDLVSRLAEHSFVQSLSDFEVDVREQRVAGRVGSNGVNRRNDGLVVRGWIARKKSLRFLSKVGGGELQACHALLQRAVVVMIAFGFRDGNARSGSVAAWSHVAPLRLDGKSLVDHHDGQAQ